MTAYNAAQKRLNVCAPQHSEKMAAVRAPASIKYSQSKAFKDSSARTTSLCVLYRDEGVYKYFYTESIKIMVIKFIAT